MLGGGISGLACAFWLTELIPQARITLFESSGRLGGLIHSIRDGDYLLEAGPLSFPSGAPATGALLAQAGLKDDCLPALPPGGISLWNGRKLIPVPKTPLDVLLRKVLSPRALARLMFEPFIPQAKAGVDMSILDFFRRRTGEGFFTSLMEPMAAGILAGDPATLSISANLPKLLSMEQKSGSLAMGFFQERFRKHPPSFPAGTAMPAAATTARGCGGLVEAIADRLRHKGVELRTSAGVRSLRNMPGRFLLRTGAGPASSVEEFDGVVSALPSHALVSIETEWPKGVLDFLTGIPHAPLCLVYLAFADSARAGGLPCDGLLPQPRAGEDILSCFAPSRMAHGRCPDNQFLLRFLVGGARKPHLARLEDDQAEALAARSARKLLGVAGEPAFARTLRHPVGLPQLLVGHVEALGRCRKTLRNQWPGFFLAGTSCQGPGIENAVASGRLAATEAAGHFLAEEFFERNPHDLG